MITKKFFHWFTHLPLSIQDSLNHFLSVSFCGLVVLLFIEFYDFSPGGSISVLVAVVVIFVFAIIKYNMKNPSSVEVLSNDREVDSETILQELPMLDLKDPSIGDYFLNLLTNAFPYIHPNSLIPKHTAQFKN